MIMLAIAAQISAPLPLQSESWFTDKDIAATLYLRAKGETTVDYGLNVAPGGVVQDCFIEKSSGNVSLDRHVCGTILHKARLQSATDASGQPTYGVYRGTVEWFNGDGDAPKASPTRPLDVTVAKLPPKKTSPVEVRVIFAVDAKGLPTTCVPQSGEKDGALARAACSQILRNYLAIPARNVAGVPMSSIQSAVVRFFKS